MHTHKRLNLLTLLLMSLKLQSILSYPAFIDLTIPGIGEVVTPQINVLFSFETTFEVYLNGESQSPGSFGKAGCALIKGTCNFVVNYAGACRSNSGYYQSQTQQPNPYTIKNGFAANQFQQTSLNQQTARPCLEVYGSFYLAQYTNASIAEDDTQNAISNLRIGFSQNRFNPFVGLRAAPNMRVPVLNVSDSLGLSLVWSICVGLLIIYGFVHLLCVVIGWISIAHKIDVINRLEKYLFRLLAFVSGPVFILIYWPLKCSTLKESGIIVPSGAEYPIIKDDERIGR